MKAEQKRYPLFIEDNEWSRHGNVREVAPNLYVGNSLSPMAKPWWGIVDCLGYAREIGIERENAIGRAARSIRRPFPEGAVPRDLLDRCSDLLAESRTHCLGTILVCCGAGYVRSAAVAYAMLRVHHGRTHSEARLLVQMPAHRGSVGPDEFTLFSAREWAEKRLTAIDHAEALRALRANS